ncbi:hypothetical protein T08_16183 [Trichinella sp. T8]|nr:hypothetical protein T08_16183 [Trichinella sp. T8]
MTENRFKNLLRFCRFDETTNTKAAQVKRDKRTAFRDMWTMFQTNLKNLYNLSAFLTDEKAEADFQPSNTNSIQTGKYWITIFWYCDAETSCPLAEEIDVGRQPGQKARMDVADLVKRFYYILKRKNCVLLLSTMHHDEAVRENQQGKPDLVLFCNEMKSGVATLDHLVSEASNDCQWFSGL